MYLGNGLPADAYLGQDTTTDVPWWQKVLIYGSQAAQQITQPSRPIYIPPFTPPYVETLPTGYPPESTSPFPETVTSYLPFVLLGGLALFALTRRR